MIVEKRTVENTLTIALALGLSLPVSAQMIERAAPLSAVGVMASVSGASYASAQPISLGTSLLAPSIAMPSIAPALGINAAPALAAAAAAVAAAASVPDAAPAAPSASASASAPAERPSAATTERQLSERIIGAQAGSNAQQTLTEAFDGGIAASKHETDEENAARVAQLVSHIYSLQSAYGEKIVKLEIASSQLSHYGVSSWGTSPWQPKVTIVSRIAAETSSIVRELQEHLKLFDTPLLQSEIGADIVTRSALNVFGPSYSAISEKFAPDLRGIYDISGALLHKAEVRLVQLERNLRAKLPESDKLLKEIYAETYNTETYYPGKNVTTYVTERPWYLFGFSHRVPKTVWVTHEDKMSKISSSVLDRVKSAYTTSLSGPVLVH